MNARFFSALALLIVCASGCVPNDAERLKEEDDIREAVFSYQFLHNASGRQQNAKVYFLSLHEGGKDPSDEFMKRFAGHTPEVKKVSQCTEDDDIRDMQTGAPGIVFRVTGIRWITAQRVEVFGGYFEGYLSSSGNTYYVEKKDGKWIVVQDNGRWIS
jgi:hypothetical protein